MDSSEVVSVQQKPVGERGKGKNKEEKRKKRGRRKISDWSQGGATLGCFATTKDCSTVQSTVQ